MAARQPPHVDPLPPSPPLVPPVTSPPTEGFPMASKAAQPHSLVTTPVQPGSRNGGLVVEPPQEPAVVTIFGDGKPEKIWPKNQNQHTPNAEGYDPTRSDTLHPYSQALLDAYSSKGQPRNKIPPGYPGFSERLDIHGEIVSNHRDRKTGIETLVTPGTIHYGKKGTHIVPAPAQPPKPRKRE